MTQDEFLAELEFWLNHIQGMKDITFWNFQFKGHNIRTVHTDEENGNADALEITMQIEGLEPEE